MARVGKAFCEFKLEDDEWILDHFVSIHIAETFILS